MILVLRVEMDDTAEKEVTVEEWEAAALGWLIHALAEGRHAPASVKRLSEALEPLDLRALDPTLETIELCERLDWLGMEPPR